MAAAKSLAQCVLLPAPCPAPNTPPHQRTAPRCTDRCMSWCLTPHWPWTICGAAHCAAVATTVDQAFLPQHYAGPITATAAGGGGGTGREMFYHTILALSPFGRNGGAFFACPSSLQQVQLISA